MDQSVTEWLLALSADYEKNTKPSALQNQIKQELFDVLSVMTQESLSEHPLHPHSQTHSPSALDQNQTQAIASESATQSAVHTGTQGTSDQHLAPHATAPTKSAPPPSQSSRKRSDEEILKALLELKNSGQLKRGSLKTTAEALTPILRPTQSKNSS